MKAKLVEDVADMILDRVLGNKELLADLTKQYDAAGLKELALHFGCSESPRNNMLKNAIYVYRAMLQSFVLGTSVFCTSMEETIEDAPARDAVEQAER